MGNTYSKLFIHLIFSTKERTPEIGSKFEDALYSYIKKSSANHELQILSVGGTTNHLHVLVNLPAKYSVSKAAQIIKGSSSRWLNKNYFTDYKFRWQRGYGAFSINQSLVPKTIKYIERQKKHHATQSFTDEFVRFLDIHNLEYKNKTIT
ncbi:IS200/IS605 family transposase [Fodinibius sp.]|uniref:IS200/IS605 family transposase n=1 Tax=Fodinibius sp. TaxID=1872440 RepID=UPI002ACE4451|nr:IS200/IS605 family transposase [Fodinibius sp.]MDZ7658537.1 IS200/IS605 family transposase [Fodinibius sp.]